jgi:hypothetical protein
MLEPRVRRAVCALLASVVSIDCGDGVTSTASAPQGACNAVITTFQGGSRGHQGECSGLSYPMSPPVFGDHYPVWAAYGSYDFPIPLGYLVHDLEHGAVVIFYECPHGCSDEVAEVQRFIDALPEDSRCTPLGIPRQVILVPRPGLGSRWAASAWGVSITADCFDPELFRRFYDEHVAHGPEDLCQQGVQLTSNPCE